MAGININSWDWFFGDISKAEYPRSPLPGSWSIPYSLQFPGIVLQLYIMAEFSAFVAVVYNVLWMCIDCPVFLS